MRHPSLSSD